MKALIVLVALAGVAEADGGPTLRGRVVDKATKKPVGGATIVAGGDFYATDDDGRFAIPLPSAGVVAFKISAEWLGVSVDRTVRVTRDMDLDIEVETKKAGETIEVVDVAPDNPGATTVAAKTARALPGGGDAGKVVQSMPAVARPPAGSAEVIVWGAAPRDTRVFVDGVPVPALYHLGGYRSAVGNDLVGDIRLQPAAFGPERGRAIGGTVDIRLADPETLPGLRGQLDVLDTSLSATQKLGGVTFAAALRQSHLDDAIGLVEDPQQLAPNAPLPRWSDAQLVARTQLARDVVATGWVMGSLDALDRTLASDDPATETVQSISQKWIRAQATIRRERTNGYDSGTFWFGRDKNRDDLQVGLIPARQSSASWVGGVRALQQTRLGGGGIAIGLDLDGESTQYRRTGSLTIPAREGDPLIFGQPPGDDVAADRWYATTIDAAGFAALDYRRGRVTATLGARVDGWMLGASRLTPRVGTTPGIASQIIDVSADPRGSVEVRVSDEAVVRFDGGRYHQARAGSDVSAVFGTPDLGLEQAWHAIVSATWRRRPFAVEIAGYARWLDDLVARDLSVTPLFAQALTQGGTGRVAGVQVTARTAQWHDLTGWLSYSLSRSTRKDADSQPERLFDHDQTHGLIAVAAWQRGPWSLGGRVRATSGEPRTGVIGSFFDSRSGRYQPIRGPHNGERLPMFFAADARAERRFDVEKTRLYLYAEVQNLTGRANAEEIIYSADFSQKSYLTSLPLLAIGGVRIER